jgi:hypothetical protein
LKCWWPCGLYYIIVTLRFNLILPNIKQIFE